MLRENRGMIIDAACIINTHGFATWRLWEKFMKRAIFSSLIPVSGMIGALILVPLFGGATHRETDSGGIVRADTLRGDVLPALAVEVFATGLDQPTFLGSAPGDMERLFAIERATARIILFKNGQRASKPFLNLSDRVGASQPEQGLLGFAFHPQYPAKRFIFVNYTDVNGDTVIERFRIRKHLDKARRNKSKDILAFDQTGSNHNGGMLAFGPLDDYLYIASGDGGGSNDPFGHGQSLDTLLGKILRIDIRSGKKAPYKIPSSNPFVGNPNALDEIWAYGLRNPWRFGFDRLTGDLYIGDVGQSAREEIDYQPASSNGGENYGWNVAEGFACLGGTGACGTNPGFTPPIHDYPRDIGRSVTGGYVYRGSAIPSLQGTYVFGDFSLARVWSFKYNGTTLSEFIERTNELDPPGPETLGNVASFGEDAAGELYIVTYGGTIYRIIEG
jgi:glucose/arabinose dehydrogenase